MKSRALLSILAGAWLLMTTGPATAHTGGHHDELRRGYHGVHYDYRARRHHAMPRWLKRHKGFRHWYRQSRYERRRNLAWVDLWDLHTREQRYDRRYDSRLDGHDRKRDRQRRHRGKGHH